MGLFELKNLLIMTTANLNMPNVTGISDLASGKQITLTEERARNLGQLQQAGLLPVLSELRTVGANSDHRASAQTLSEVILGSLVKVEGSNGAKANIDSLQHYGIISTGRPIASGTVMLTRILI